MKRRHRLQPPRPQKIALARARLTEFFAAAGEAFGAGFKTLPDAAAVEALLLGLADQSPFLWGLIRRDPARLLRLRQAPPETALDQALQQALAKLSVCDRAEGSESQAMSVLRKAKQDSALIVALADLAGEIDTPTATRLISRAADVFVKTALRVALRLMGDKIALENPENPEENCGLTVLALGKHGASELNYSSDVDLVIFYDAGSKTLSAGPGVKANSLSITQRLVKLLQERSGDGYVLRVDLRLRPDPGSTAPAVSLGAARHYYETLGQNWERAAMIKARPVAGDFPLGREFLQEMAAFIWRKYFDYAAIADIHAMKRQIHAAKGHAEIAVAGHDVKLGRGGIREIEFFVQTQQLIFGGRRKLLRGARTLDMLKQLCADRWITPEAEQDLSAAYVFLRAVEHRLQMLNDHQTQRLPEDPTALKNFARFCGYAGTAGFSRDLLGHLRAVEKHYARLFEHAPGLDSRAGNLVFAGAAIDPETLDTLRGMGFKQPEKAAETLRGWHFGRRPAVRSPRAREVLTELTPALLDAFARSGDADSGMAAFDEALARMPAAAELFSLLKSNAAMRELFADILGGAPRLAEVIAQTPHVLDVAIDRGLMAAPMDFDDFSQRLDQFSPDNASFEAFLDAARQFGHEENFMIGLRLFAGLIEPDAAARAYSALAEALIAACLRRVEAEFRLDHGRVPGGRCAVLGFGKLGSREMTATSDLDLVLLYDFDAETPDSDGARPLHATLYYTRLTQRLIAALSAPTRRGKLFEVDLRLRPSGNKGPVATKIASFRAYQAEEAEIWEHMALTRARPLAGDVFLRAQAESVIVKTLTTPHSREKLAQAARDMRALIASEKGDHDGWNLKLASGGLLDIEFLAQYLALAHFSTLPADFCRPTATAEVLELAVARGWLAEDDGALLMGALALFSNVTQWLRLALGEGADPRKAAEGVKRRIAAAVNLPGFSLLDRELQASRKAVRGLFVEMFVARLGVSPGASPDAISGAAPDA